MTGCDSIQGVAFKVFKLRPLPWYGQFRNFYSFDFRCLSRSDFAVTMVGDDSLSNGPWIVAIPLRQMGVEIAVRRAQLPTLHEKDAPASSHSLPFAVASAQVKSAHFAALQAKVNRRLSRRKDAWSYGGYDSPIWWRDPSGWKPSASKVVKSSKVKKSSFLRYLCSLLVSGWPHSQSRVWSRLKMLASTKRGQGFSVIQEMGRSHHWDRDEKAVLQVSLLRLSLKGFGLMGSWFHAWLMNCRLLLY